VALLRHGSKGTHRRLSGNSYHACVHDDERTREMRFWKGFIMTVALVAIAASASAQTPPRAVAVFWDEAATQQYATLAGGINVFHTAYVFIVNNWEHVGGVSFMLEVDPRVQIMGAMYPEAIKFGEPTEGVSIGFMNCHYGWYGEPILATVLTLWTGTELMTNAEIKVVDHPHEQGIKISDCQGQLADAEGWSAYLTVAVDNDDTSWGAFKAMYR
jgi:hypothetical protein